jgi:Lipopolysaccharide kinase (Kdo/WaaP) family
LSPRSDGAPIAALARLIDAVRVNVTTEIVRDGRRLLLKRRRKGCSALVACGNVFLALARSNIVMFPSVRAWQAWELHSYALLHGGGRRAAAVGRDAIVVEALPGETLARRLARGGVTPAMMAAAARELGRAHALAWSHGDPHLGNVLYDEAADRAYLIDFETRHEPRLNALERHADDVLVLLMDVMASEASPRWLELARAFVAAYPARAPFGLVHDRLSPPDGLARVLWRIRTHHRPAHWIIERASALRALLRFPDSGLLALRAPR